MKKATIFLFFVLQFMILNGQTVSIGCSGGGTDCFSVACVTPNTYVATISDGPLGGYTRTITWTATGPNTSAITSGNNLSFSVT